jgi:myosin-3
MIFNFSQFGFSSQVVVHPLLETSNVNSSLFHCKGKKPMVQIVLQFHVKYRFKARSDNAPHIFSVADRAYQDMLHHEEPQYILLAGETLSGKTTTMTQLLRHLLFLGQVPQHYNAVEMN